MGKETHVAGRGIGRRRKKRQGMNDVCGGRDQRGRLKERRERRRRQVKEIAERGMVISKEIRANR